MNNICRAKDLINGKWLYGYYIECLYYSDNEPVGAIIPVDTILYPHCELEEIRIVDLNTVCRYTGLTDKSGTPVYEHDYVRTEFGRICEVVWFSSPQHCGWDLAPVAKFDCPPPREYSMWESVNLEIIGNKFDNTELMED